MSKPLTCYNYYDSEITKKNEFKSNNWFHNDKFCQQQDWGYLLFPWARLFGIKFSLPILIRTALPTTFCYDRDYEKVSGRIKQQFHETTFGTLCSVLRQNMPLCTAKQTGPCNKNRYSLFPHSDKENLLSYGDYGDSLHIAGDLFSKQVVPCGLHAPCSTLFGIAVYG